jgi:hypothetical protein
MGPDGRREGEAMTEASSGAQMCQHAAYRARCIMKLAAASGLSPSSTAVTKRNPSAATHFPW